MHLNNKIIFIHIDLSEGIGKDRSGIEYLSRSGADGIISTRANLIRIAKEFGLLTVQRFFAYDSQGVKSINDVTCGDRISVKFSDGEKECEVL